MKNLIKIFVLLAIFATVSFAQTTAGYWTTQTKGYSQSFSQDGYEYGYTSATAPADTAYYIVSRPIGQRAANGDVRNGFMGSKVLLGINITVAFTDVAATLVTQISLDGTNWYDFATTDSDVTPNVTGIQTYLVDFTSVYAPYVRLKFNASGLTIHTSGRVAFLYAIPL